MISELSKTHSRAPAYMGKVDAGGSTTLFCSDLVAFINAGCDGFLGWSDLPPHHPTP